MAKAYVRVLGVAALALVSGCNKSSPTSPSNGTTYTVTISSTGVSPKSMDVPLGARVTFVNNDTKAHYMHSDPHPDATDCPAFNQVGLLAATQRRESGNLVEARTCGYHDHDDPTNAAFRGQVVVE